MFVTVSCIELVIEMKESMIECKNESLVAVNKKTTPQHLHHDGNPLLKFQQSVFLHHNSSSHLEDMQLFRYALFQATYHSR